MRTTSRKDDVDVKIVEDLRGRRQRWYGALKMLWHVSEALGESDIARVADNVLFMVMDEMRAIDQALAVIDEGTTVCHEIEMMCSKCGAKKRVKAVVNVFGDGGASKECRCECGELIGSYRQDSDVVPRGYSLVIEGVLGYEQDKRPIGERKADAESLIKSGRPDAKEEERKASIRQKLEAAKSKIGKADVLIADAGDDF